MPKYIIVGEVRAAEAEAAVEAMATGHSTHFTMHAGVPIDAVNRLVTKYLMVRLVANSNRISQE